VDGRLADLLTQVGTTRTAFMVVSDHGAQGRGNVTLFERRSDRLLEAMGYLSFRSDVDVDEIDTESSLVIPGTETGTMVQFWVNVRNPELEDPARRDEVAQRCLAALRGLRFDRSGRRVFEKIGRSSKDSDVLIARLGVTELDLDDSVTLRGRSFPIQDFYAPLSLGGVRDVAPTVLAAMGLPIPDSMDGRVLEPVFEPAFREGRSFSSEPVEIDWEPYDPEGLDTEAPDLMVEMLRALGYAR
jgi:predicted AlkP superfamily phosphohydrolase/phosphomutase